MLDRYYKRPMLAGEFDLEVKKSRFLVRYTPITAKTEALEFIESWRVSMPDARHHCWAYLVGNPQNPSFLAMSDDGEPSGTAGGPMVNAIQGKSVGDICVVVIRYFGGTRLGAGGLIRAYGGSVSQALDRAEFEEVRPKLIVKFSGGYELEQAVRHWVGVNGGEVLSVDYNESVRFIVSIELESEAAFHSFLHAYGAFVEVARSSRK